MSLCAKIKAALAAQPMTTREIREMFELSRPKSHETIRGLWADGWLDRTRPVDGGDYTYTVAAVKRPSIRMRTTPEQHRVNAARHRRKMGVLPLAEHLAKIAANKKPPKERVRVPKEKKPKLRTPTATRTTELRPVYASPHVAPKVIERVETTEEFLARGGAIERL